MSHLINWSIVRGPKSHGDMGIKDPSLMNLALGAKLLCRLVVGRYDWWKKFSSKNTLCWFKKNMSRIVASSWLSYLEIG